MANPITAAQRKAIFPAAADGYLQQVCAESNTNLAAYGLDTAQRKAHFFAQGRQDSGPGIEAQVESLAYGPEALVSLFAYYKQHPTRQDRTATTETRSPSTNAGRPRRRRSPTRATPAATATVTLPAVTAGASGAEASCS
jgi:predicted chitinase